MPSGSPYAPYGDGAANPNPQIPMAPVGTNDPASGGPAIQMPSQTAWPAKGAVMPAPGTPTAMPTWPTTAPPLPPPSTMQYSTPAWAAPPAGLISQPTVPSDKLVQSSWYTRIDYFHWNERIGSMDFVNESGALYTLGYSRRIGQERFRAELFGGSMDYKGYGQFDDGSIDTLGSTTRYLGARDMIFFVGIGSRFWIRDIQSGVSDGGYDVYGYQETWWTIYPYIGLEAKRMMASGWELYSSGRVGMTAFTYDHAAILDEPLWPKCGIMGSVELGLRGPHFSASAYFEAMTWRESAEADDAFQPNSQMYTIGGKIAYTF
jgi:hypothetical protein